MKKYDIWSSGYCCSGMEGVPEKARLHGQQKARSFQEACDVFFKDDEYYVSKNLTRWACGLYDNEKDARKAFG